MADGDGVISRTDDPDQPPELPASFTPPAVDPVAVSRRKETFGEVFSGRDTGAVGFHFPDRERVYVSPRDLHHNGMMDTLVRDGVSLQTRLVPFVIDTYPVYDDGDITGTGIELDYPRSAGGAYQYFTRNLRDTDAELIQQARQGVTVADVYAVVYAARVLDTPDAADATVSFESPDIPDAVRGVIADSDRVSPITSQNARVGDYYRELRFADQLPPATVARGAVFGV